MKNTGIRRGWSFWAAAVLLAGLAAGCVNPYHDFYQSTLERWPGSVATRVLAPQGPPRMASSTDMRKDAHYLLENGYVLLGRSKFKSPALDENAALEQAGKIGAWVVLVDHKYAETVTEQVAQVTILPDQTVTDSRTFTDRKGETRTVTRTHTVSGGTQVDWVPTNVDYYNYAATYWAKTLPSPFGVLVKGPRANSAEAAASPGGLLVQILIQGSPASKSLLQEGDRLTSINGESLENVDQFYDAVSRYAGQTVPVGFTRNGQAMTTAVSLGAE